MGTGLAAEINWGDVPTWLGAILTGTSFVVAALAYRKSVYASIAQQAAGVTAWADEGQLHIKNNTSGAVYAIIAFYPKKDYREATRDIISPFYLATGNNKTVKKIHAVATWDSIAPTSEVVARMSTPSFTSAQVPWLYFRDSQGYDWIRDYRGNLERRRYYFMEIFSAGWYGRRVPLGLRLGAGRQYLYVNTKHYIRKALGKETDD